MDLHSQHCEQNQWQHWENAVFAKNHSQCAIHFAGGILTTTGICFKNILNTNVTHK